ncbi:hypothetical protein RUND412_003743 [Rhizina undulata]
MFCRFRPNLTARFTHTMSTINLPPPHSPIPVHLPHDLPVRKLTSFYPFTAYLSTLTHSLSLQSSPSHPFHASPYSLKSLTIQSFDLFGSPPNQRLGFLKLQAEIKSSTGETLPGSIFLRGGSVAILFLLEVIGEEAEKWVVLTVQPRIPAGSLEFVEIPAGMLDGGTFSGAAAKEIEEECGVKIEEAGLIDLTSMALGRFTQGGEEKLQEAFYMSPGGSDEYMKLFAYVHRIEKDTLHEWQGKLTGLRHEGEKITLKIVKFADLWRETRDAKALSALALWEGLKREGNI